MKRTCVSVILFCFEFYSGVFGQGTSEVRLKSIEPVAIAATVNETTSLIFPFAITTADWGSNGIMVQQVKTAKNILHVKAARPNFAATNLSVVTSDGNFYAFRVVYDAAPGQLNYIVQRDTNVAVANVADNALLLQREGSRVHSMRSFLHFSKKVLLTTLQLSGVYTGQRTIWFKLQLSNRSWVNFPVGYVRFFLKDRRILKRRVVQEKELIPVYSDPLVQINGKQRAEMVYGFSPFTVPKGQRLMVQVGEKGEGRFIELGLPGRKVLRAKKIIP